MTILWNAGKWGSHEVGSKGRHPESAGQNQHEDKGRRLKVKGKRLKVKGEFIKNKIILSKFIDTYEFLKSVAFTSLQGLY